MHMQYAKAVVAHEETHSQTPRLPICAWNLPPRVPATGHPAMPDWPRGRACL